jgi:DNA-binding transcriptional regulator YhcF (GntR family)
LSSSSKHIADRIRLMIATKQFQVGEVLPSTRILGQQLGASFHTVRKAYHQLEEEGLLRGEVGRGFVVVRQNVHLDKSERLEMGASKMRTVLEELIGFGLNEDEIESIFEEQLRFVDWPERLQTCATLGSNKELSEQLARAIKQQVGVSSDVITTDQHTRFANYDALFVPLPLMRSLKFEHEEMLLIPIVYSPDPEMLLSLSEHLVVDTVGIVSTEESSISIIIEELKINLRYSGSIMAGTIYGKSLPLFVRDVDLIIYTASAASLVEKLIPEKRRLAWSYLVSEPSASAIRAELWDQ